MTQQVTKQMPCSGCGEPMTVGIRTRIQPRCLECGIRAAYNAMRDMKLKSGPYYEKWLERRWQTGDPRWGATPRARRRNGGRSVS